MSSKSLVVVGSLVLSLTAAMIAAPAMASPGGWAAGGTWRANDRDSLNQELAERGKNRRIASKRTGKGSVLGARELRSKAGTWNKSKKVHLLIAHSSDGTVAGFTGATSRTVRASQVEAEITKAEADKTAVSIDVVGAVRAMTSAQNSYPGGGEYEQWALGKLQAEQVWHSAKGDGVKVAVLDTGVQGDHPDLAGQLLSGKDYVDEDNVGSVDPHGHGTHVAGIIAAAMNDFGVTGLAPNAKIIPIRVLPAEGTANWAHIVDGIYEAADRGADIINMSLGGKGTNYSALNLAVEYAHLKGASVVASSGNSGDDTMYLPAGTPGVLGVGGTTSGDVRTWDSTYNSSVDLSAPGESIYSTTSGSGYEEDSGTSMATPYVSATLALTLQAARQSTPGATAVGVEQLVQDNSVDLGEPGRDDEFGVGRVDPLAVVRVLLPAQPAMPAKSVPAKAKPTRTKLKMTVKTKRLGGKKRSVTIRSRNAMALRVTMVKKVRGKWRVQRAVVLRKNGRITLRLGPGQYRLKRSATVTSYSLNFAFRVR